MSNLPVAIRYFSTKQGGIALIISHIAPVFPKINVKQVTTTEEALKAPHSHILIIDTSSISEDLWSATLDGTHDIPKIFIIDKMHPETIKRLLKKENTCILTSKELNSTTLVRTVHNVLERQKLQRQLSAARQQLQELSTRDTLTNLHNVRYLNDALDLEMKKTRRYKANLTMLLVGVDRFKELNEIHGHEACDRLLAEVAIILMDSVREVDTVARLNGDEFSIILPETDLGSASKVAERILNAIRSFPYLEGRSGITVTASIGVAPWEVTFHTPNDLINASHRAMLEAKRNGRDTICTLQEAENNQHLKLKENTRLIQNIKQQISLLSEEMRKSYFQSIVKLFEAIPHFKRGLANHLDRVAFYSERLATRIGMSQEEIAAVRKAGLLHDLGKIAIDERLLSKPQRLSTAESTLIRQHPTIAVQLLGQTLFLKNELSMILHHHEQFNGRGYPDQIDGNTIPIGARIIAITEAWDTMITNQPYRSALSLDQALGEIKKGAGTQFDPELAMLFISLVE